MIIGIDPGFTGAIAFLRKNDLVIYDLPIRMIKGKRQIDENELHKILKAYLYSNNIKYAVLEDVWVMPNQGIVSSGRFMYNAGILLGALAAYDVTIIKTKPGVWKSALGLSKDKKKSLALAKKLFPAYKDYFRLMKHDGRAEAALIAHFAKVSL